MDLVLVTIPADRPNVGRVERELTLAWDRGARPVVVLTKTDLGDRRLADELASRLVGADKPDLCRVYAVSRPTIREAVKSLEAMRLVEAKQGSGTRVRPVDEWDLIHPLVFATSAARGDDLEMLDEITRLRGSIEGPVAGRAATRADAADVERLRQSVNDMDRALDDPSTYLGLGPIPFS